MKCEFRPATLLKPFWARHDSALGQSVFAYWPVGTAVLVRLGHFGRVSTMILPPHEFHPTHQVTTWGTNKVTFALTKKVPA